MFLVASVAFMAQFELVKHKNGSRSNGNEGVFHTPRISRTGASPSDAVSYPVYPFFFARDSK